MTSTHHLTITPETPITADLVQHYADAVIAEIGAWDDGNQTVLTCWHDIHGRIDANELTEAAGVPWGADVATDDDPSGSRWITVVEAAVDAQLHDASGTAPCGQMAATDEVTGLTWESAGNDEPGDQNADSALMNPDCTSLYWSVGPDGDRLGFWHLSLIGVNHGDEVESAYEDHGWFVGELAAKTAAETSECRKG